MGIRAIFVLLLFSFVGCSGLEGSHFGGIINVKNTTKEQGPSKNSDGTVNFTWKDMLPTYMHYTPNLDYNNYVSKYLSSFYPSEWRKVKNNEFEINKAKNKYIEEMKLLASDYDPSTIYTGRLNVYLGEYDIEKKHFPLVQYGKTIPLSILNIVISTKQPTGGGNTITDTRPFPNKFQVSLDQSLPNLPIAEAPVKPGDAEIFVKSRNEKAGYRRAKAVLKFKILGVHTDGISSKYSALVTDILYEL